MRRTMAATWRSIPIWHKIKSSGAEQDKVRQEEAFCTAVLHASCPFVNGGTRWINNSLSTLLLGVLVYVRSSARRDALRTPVLERSGQQQNRTLFRDGVPPNALRWASVHAGLGGRMTAV